MSQPATTPEATMPLPVAPPAGRARATVVRFYSTIKSAKYGTYLTAPNMTVDNDPATLSATVGPAQMWMVQTIPSDGSMRLVTPTNGHIKPSTDVARLVSDADDESDGAIFVVEVRQGSTPGVPATNCIRVNINMTSSPKVMKYMRAQSTTAVYITAECGAGVPTDLSADWIIEPIPFGVSNRGKFLSFPTAIGTSNLFTMSTDSTQKFTCVLSSDDTNYLRSKDSTSSVITGFVGGDRAASAGSCVVATGRSGQSMMCMLGLDPVNFRIRFGPSEKFVSTSEYKFLKVSSAGVFSLTDTYSETVDFDDYVFTLEW